MALLETLRRCYGDPTSVLLRVYQNEEHDAYNVHAQSAHRRMAFYHVVGDPTATNERPLSCCGTGGDSTACTLPFYIIVRIALRTQQRCDRGFTSQTDLINKVFDVLKK